jgi:hypothetical protein
MLLRTFIKNIFVPRKALIHDCIDTGTELGLVAGDEIQFPCDCASYEYKSDSTKTLWNNTTGNVKDTIDNALIHLKFKVELKGNKDSLTTININVPHPDGDILIDSIDIRLSKNNEYRNYPVTTWIYNGTAADAKDYGFNISIVSEDGALLKGRSIGVAIG